MVHIPLPITKGLRWANWAPAGREGAVADPVNGAVPLHSNNWEKARDRYSPSLRKSWQIKGFCTPAGQLSG